MTSKQSPKAGESRDTDNPKAGAKRKVGENIVDLPLRGD
jgi:hypothetical protein